jgi:hypothetical protein
LTLILSSLLAVPVKAETSDARAALKEAGFAALPEFLDAATSNITVKFPRSLGGSTLTFGGTIDAEALQEKRFVFTTSDEHKLNWNDAFGMPFLDLSEVALSLSAEKGNFELSLDGLLGGAFRSGGKPRSVAIDLVIEDNKLSDFTLSLPDTRLGLHTVPELKTIPGATQFAIEAPVISMHALGGKIAFAGETADAVVFYDEEEKDWNLGLAFEKAMTLAQLTGHKGSFLDHLGLPQLQLLVSTKGLKRPYDDLPLAAQAFFTAAQGEAPSGELSLPAGASLLAHFDPAVAPSNLKGAMKHLGLGSAVLDIDGEVEGLFGGEPAVELTVEIDTPTNNSFKFLKTKHAKAEFFIKLSKQEAALGFRTAIELSQGSGKPSLEFDVDFEFAAQQDEAEVAVSGGMQGDWINAAGIKGLTLENPFMSVGINESGSFDMLIDGAISIGPEKIRAAADLVLSPEALGLPTAFAFAGEINEIDFNVLMAHAKKHAPQKNGGFSHMKAGFKDVAFAYMTPGAHLPADLEEELSIEGEGMALKATLLVNGKELGQAKGYASTEGVSIDGELDPFKLGPLDLKDANLSIELGPEVEAKFAMSGDLELFKGFEEAYSLDIEPTKFRFSSDTQFGGAFEAELTAESDGLSFASANDFAFEADLAAKYNGIFRDMVQTALKGFKKSDSALKKAENDVKAAEQRVQRINSSIQAEEANAKRAYDDAVRKIDDAENKVNDLNRTIAYNKKKAHDFHDRAKSDAKHLKLGRAGAEKTEEAALDSAIAAEEASLKTAEWALETAKKTVKVVPVDAAPKVIALKTALGTEEAGLKVAQGALEAARGANKGVELAVKAIGEGLTALKINKIGAAGSLKGILTNGEQGEKPVLIIDVTVHGKQHTYRENLGTLKSEFKKLGQDIAKEVAKEVLKAFNKN